MDDEFFDYNPQYSQKSESEIVEKNYPELYKRIKRTQALFDFDNELVPLFEDMLKLIDNVTPPSEPSERAKWYADKIKW